MPMTEPETEAETLDRLEAALARIAAHVKAPAPPAQAAMESSHQVDPTILNALDAMITRLRSVLDEPAAANGEE